MHEIILGEWKRQNEGMELIASENYASPAVREPLSSVLGNKYAEWFPGRRYYGWQEFTDQCESLAIARGCELFRSDHANVQALSGAAANVAIYNALMEPGDTILGMDLSHGGHLTHGAPVTMVNKFYNFVRYKTDTSNNHLMNYDLIAKSAKEHKPKIIIAGYSAYPRELDYDTFMQIADDVGAVAFADVSHFGGLIAGGVMKNPLDAGFHVMMTTTHKTLRGPRGAAIFSKGKVSNPLKKPEDTFENIPTRIDRSVFPGTQWWPHIHQVAGIGVAFHEAMQPEFQKYAQQIISNNKALAEVFLSHGYNLVTWGTENNIIVIDFQWTGMNGRKAETTLDKIGISTSKSTVPDDPNPPFRPSGLRLGMPAMTSRGCGIEETKQIGAFIHAALQACDDDQELSKIREEVREFCLQYPVEK